MCVYIRLLHSLLMRKENIFPICSSKLQVEPTWQRSYHCCGIHPVVTNSARRKNWNLTGIYFYISAASATWVSKITWHVLVRSLFIKIIFYSRFIVTYKAKTLPFWRPIFYCWIMNTIRAKFVKTQKNIWCRLSGGRLDN